MALPILLADTQDLPFSLLLSMDGFTAPLRSRPSWSPPPGEGGDARLPPVRKAWLCFAQ